MTNLLVAYLVAYAAATSLALGALVLVMITQLTAATWFVVVRRRAESLVAALPVLAVLSIPLLVGVRALYPWASTNSAQSTAWLNVPFFIVRTVIYWVVWLSLGERFLALSRRQDTNPRDATPKIRTLSAFGLVLLALTMCLASFDWLMSLTPAWSSTVYPIYWYAGGQIAALASLALFARRTSDINTAHVSAIAKLLLTFILLWLYLGYSQLIVIWSANVPAEVTWYIPRMRGAWRGLSLVLLIGGGAIPFFALVLGAIRRNRFLIAALGAWLLVVHWLDSLWLVVPSVPDDAQPGWLLSLIAMIVVSACAIACGAWRSRDVPPLPQGDPRLAASLDYAPE